jgi:hypothetical protein
LVLQEDQKKNQSMPHRLKAPIALKKFFDPVSIQNRY